MNSSSEQGLVDLHAHSTASDGMFSPRSLVRLAKETGLSAVALTDHDTLEGLEEANYEANKCGIDFVPGIEISCDFGDQVFHILGLFIEFNNPLLNKTITELLRNRENRNYLLIDRLKELGIDIRLDDLRRLSGNSVIGRPHFAQSMLENGYVNSIEEAFTSFLSKGKKAYIPKKRLTAEEGIRLIDHAKGISCLAHPMVYPYSSTEIFRKTIETLISFGLQAIEVYYSEHSEDQIRFLERIARDYKLLISGGSDFHGGNIHPDNKLGSGIKGNLNIKRDIYENMFNFRLNKSLSEQDYL